MRIDFNISQAEAGKFYTACEAVIRNVGNSSQAAVEYAGWDIMSESLGQVPIDTGALISSAFLGVSERGDVAAYRYGAVLGYGSPSGLASQMNLGYQTKTIKDPGGVVEQGGKVIKTVAGGNVRIRTEAPIKWLMEPSESINPKTGLPASAYAARVHEDLDMPHPNGGKAKFLEDPIRNWASGKFARTAMTYWSVAIKTVTHKQYSNVFRFGRATGKYRFTTYKANHYEFVERGKGVQRGGEYVRNGESQ